MDCVDVGKTFQMSLDAFLEENHPVSDEQEKSYGKAILVLEESRLFRSWQKKQAIAKDALAICPECVEAYMLLAAYEEDVIKRLSIYKEGMQVATLNLGKDFFMRQVHDFYECEEAKSFFQIKYMYATTLYEMGCMRKAQEQFQEILNLNPSDVYHVHHYLYVLSLYFEECSTTQWLLSKYDQDRAIDVYVKCLLYMKMERYKEAIALLPSLKQANASLYDMLTYRSMNTTRKAVDAQPGSDEEASYLYHIFHKVLPCMEYLPEFFVKHE